MKALLMESWRNLVYQDVPTPQPGAGEVRVRIRACAVCGSDVHGIDGSTGRRRPPIIMGHEAAGVIDCCGEGVSGWKPGDRVTFDSTIYCGECAMCRAGHVNLCADRRVLGVSCEDYRMHGAFAEYVCVPERVLYRLPENVSFVQGAMVEPLSIAYHAATRTPVLPGMSAMIAGVGTIGMMTLQVVRSMGAERIVAVDVDEKRLQMAMENGASHAVNARDPHAADEIVRLTGGVDVSYDATGIGATFALCTKCTALNGKIVLIGNLTQTVDLPLQWVVTRQQSIFGSCASAGEYPQCLELIASGKVDVNALISRVVPLREGNEWINRVYEREEGLYKIVLEME